VKLLLLAFGLLKFSKIAATAGTMLLSLVIYAQIWGWRFAAGFIALLFAHEMGHYIAAQRRGLAVGAPVFIPFVGAWIALKEQPMTVETEAYVAFAGPFVGTLAAFAVYFWSRDTGSTVLFAVAYSGFLLNLFNLLPLSPLDGGRITAVLTPRVWLIGAPLMLLLLIYQPNPIVVMIAIISAPQLMKAWRYDPHAPENAAYYGISHQTRFEYAVLYLGLAAVLALMSYDMHLELETARLSRGY
jgi:Zn-dependent protease